MRGGGGGGGAFDPSRRRQQRPVGTSTIACKCTSRCPCPAACRRFLDNIAPLGTAAHGSPGSALAALRLGAAHAALLVFASSCLAMAQLGLCRPMRLW